MSKPIVTIGTDPEAMLFNVETNKFVAACGLIGGTKEKPLHFNAALPLGFTIQEDNVAVEWNIPPCHDRSEWMENLQLGATGAAKFVATKGPFVLKYLSHVKLPNKEMRSEQAMKFGCSPEFDAYNAGEEVCKIDSSILKTRDGHWRFAGGHIHIGYVSEVPAFVAAAFADYFIGLESVGEDPQTRRRPLYGMPGRYRPTPYGIEYRTLSNYWLTHPDLHYRIGSAALGLGRFLSLRPLDSIKVAYQRLPWEAVRKSIVDQDLPLRNKIFNYVRDEREFYRGRYSYDSAARRHHS